MTAVDLMLPQVVERVVLRPPHTVFVLVLTLFHTFAMDVLILLNTELAVDFTEFQSVESEDLMLFHFVEVKNQLHETERSINNLVKMVEKGVESDTIADRLKELEKEKRAIEKRLVVAQDDYVILEKDHIVWWLSEFCNGDIEDEEFRRHIIDLLVNSVTVWDEPDGWYKITSVYNLTSNKTKTFRCSDLSGQAPPKRNDNFLSEDCRFFLFSSLLSFHFSLFS